MWFWISFSPIGQASSTSKKKIDVQSDVQLHEDVSEVAVREEVCLQRETTYLIWSFLD